MIYIYHLMIYLTVYLMLAASLDLLVGYCGILHVAQAAFFGFGAYTASLAALHVTPDLFFGLAVAGIAAALVSPILSVPASRLAGDSMTIASIGIQVAAISVFHNWTSVTGGPVGLAGIPGPYVFGTPVRASQGIFLVYGIVVFIILVAVSLLKSGIYGRSLLAMKDDRIIASSIGVRCRRLRVETIALSAAMAGLAGALYARYSAFVDPTSFSLDESILLVSMIVVGGTGTIAGPLIGATTLLILPEALRLFIGGSAAGANIKQLIYGILLVLIVLWRPKGIAGRFSVQ